MRIQPNDILNKEFKKAFRGLDPDDVIDFLDQLYEDYEFFYNENEELKRKIAELELKASNIDDTVNIEDMLQQAEDMYNQKIREAEKESRNIIQQARLEAQKIIDDAIANARKQEEVGQTANEIIEKANVDADNIRKNAEKEAELIIRQAREKADTIIKEAEEKALEVEQIRQDMKSAEDTIQNAHKEAEQIIQNAHKEAEQIIQNAQSQLTKEKEVEKEITEVFDLQNFKDMNPILDQARIKAYEIIEKAKTNEIEYKREILRLKNQKERYIMGYKELLSRQIKSADDKIEA